MVTLGLSKPLALDASRHPLLGFGAGQKEHILEDCGATMTNASLQINCYTCMLVIGHISAQLV